VALKALVTPGATYTLSYEGQTMTVRFRSEDHPPVSAAAIIPRPNHADTDYYNNVRIKLMKVT